MQSIQISMAGCTSAGLVGDSGTNPMAHLQQRRVGPGNRATHGLHTAALGQVRQTAHWLGSFCISAEKLKPWLGNADEGLDRLNTQSM